jgi:hypothetical protein
VGTHPKRIPAPHAHGDTSLVMIEKNYLRYIIGDPTDVLTRATLLDIGALPTERTNVVHMAMDRQFGRQLEITASDTNHV